MRQIAIIPAAVLLAAAVGGAQGAFPGKNGKILFGQGKPADVYAVGPDGKGLAQLTRGDDDDGSPDVSPDGKRILFTRCSAAGTARGCDVYVMNADGTGVHRLTTAGKDGFAAWSPNGKRIAFASYRDGTFPVNGVNFPNYELYVMNSDGSGQTRLTTAPQQMDLNPAWSPDGARIAWHVGEANKADGCTPTASGLQTFELWVMNADGSGQRRLTPSGPPCEVEPDWSPDGKRLAFAETPSPANYETDARIAVVSADGGGRKVLVAGDYNAVTPRWSPDGTAIVFRSASYPTDPAPQGLFKVAAAGGTPTPLLPKAILAGGMDWGPAAAAPKLPLCKKGQKPTKKKPCRTP
jgi:TolB protein